MATKNDQSRTSAIVSTLDSIYGIGHVAAPFREFGRQLNLGRELFRCPLNSREGMVQRQIGGIGNYIILIIVNLLGAMIVSAIVTVPLLKLMRIRNGSMLAIAVLVGGFLLVVSVGFAGIYYLSKKLASDRPWELNVYELGLELQTPKIHLRTIFDQISDIHFGTRIAALENRFAMALYMNPLYIGIVKTMSSNILTIRLSDGKVFRIPNAKAVFQEEPINRIIERIWLTRKLPPRVTP